MEHLLEEAMDDFILECAHKGLDVPHELVEVFRLTATALAQAALTLGKGEDR